MSDFIERLKREKAEAEAGAEAEIKWLNDYHKKVYANVSPLLAASEKAWLKKACAAI